MEKEMKEVCDGIRNKDNVYGDMKREMKEIFERVFTLIPTMKSFLLKFLEENKDYESQLNINIYPGRRNGNNDNNDDGGDDNNNRGGISFY